MKLSDLLALALAILLCDCARADPASQLLNMSFGVFDRNSTDRIPLTDIHFDLHVVDGVMRTEIVQTYHNARNRSIDAYYVFPVNYAMAVTNFSVQYAHDPSLTLYGKLLPKHLAREAYDELRNRGHGAAYMGYDKRQQDMLSLELGNIKPDDTVRVKVSFVELLQVEDLSWAVRIPTTFVPPYHSGMGKPSASATTPTTRVPYCNLTLSLEIDSSSPITRLVSPSHDIVSRFAFGKRKAWVRFAEGKALPNRDIVVLYRSARIGEPQAVVQKSSLHSSYAVLVSFLPFGQDRAETKRKMEDGVDSDPTGRYYNSAAYLESRNEFVFLIDCSGSMSGRIKQAKEAAQIFVKSLPRDSYFSFILFGSDYRVIVPTVKYSAEAAQNAWNTLESVDANMGGTEIYQALEYIFALPQKEGYQRNVLVMTDGEVTNPDDVISLAKKHAGHGNVYLHAIGIGSGASRHLVQGAADAGRGASYFITDGERIMPKVIEALTNMCSAKIHGISVAWPTTPTAEFVPRTGFYGRQVLALAILPEKPAGRLVLRGHSGADGKPVEYDVQLTDVDTIPGQTIYQLAVRAALAAGSVSDTRQQEGLSMTYSVLTESTAFVAARLYTNPANRSQTEEVRVPVMEVMESRTNEPLLLIQTQNVYHMAKNTVGGKRTVLAARGPSPDMAATVEDTATDEMETKGGNNKLGDDTLLGLVRLQDADGAFALDDTAVSAYLHTTLEEIKRGLSAGMRAQLSKAGDDRILKTVVGVYIVDTKFAGEMETSLVRLLATAWLEKQGADYVAARKELDAMFAPKTNRDP